jgi:hypothetical protein
MDGINYRMYDPKTQKVMVTRNIVSRKTNFLSKLVRKLKPWTYSRKRQSTLMYHMMLQAQPVTLKRMTTIYLPNQHRKAPLKMVKMNSQMRKIHLSLDRKILRKIKLHFLIGGIQIG